MKKILALAILFLFSSNSQANDCGSAKALLKEGDLIFLEIDHTPFSQVAESTSSWTSHVGIAFLEPVSKKGGELKQWVVYESGVPLSRVTELCTYLSHSTHGRFAITRYRESLESNQIETMREKAKSMLGVVYHTGFDFDDWRQFCSKFTYLIYQAVGIEAGKLITFQDLFDALPTSERRESLVTFWKRWFWAGFRWSGIPWTRRTVTPASQLLDPRFDLVMGKREI